MSLRKNAWSATRSAVLSLVLAGAGAAFAGASGQATADQLVDLSLIKLDASGNCATGPACIKLNRYVLTSTTLVRQLLVQNGIVFALAP